MHRVFTIDAITQEQEARGENATGDPDYNGWIQINVNATLFEVRSYRGTNAKE